MHQAELVENEACPLESIDTLVGKDNVFVNLQAASPKDLLLDLADSSLWKPYLTDRIRESLLQDREGEELVRVQKAVVPPELYA